MTTLELRPLRLDVRFRPGETYTARLIGPDGWLVGRDFVATLGDIDLGIEITDNPDTLKCTVTANDSGAFTSADRHVRMEIREDGGNMLLVGDWFPSDRGAPSQVFDFDLLPGTFVVNFETVEMTIPAVIDGNDGPDIIDGGGP